VTRGRFISLEGIDGAGKSAQIGRLAEWLRSTGRRVATCRDPGSTPVGDAVRAILLDRHDLHLAGTAEMFLYMAARAQMVAEVIEPAVGRGEWVGLDPETIRDVGRIATAGRMPDLVILLDVDLETSARRLARPLDKLENRGDEYRSRLRSGYRDEATRQPERIVTIDATAGVEDVAAAIRLAVTTRFPELA
jgi:dTMP kinase